MVSMGSSSLAKIVSQKYLILAYGYFYKGNAREIFEAVFSSKDPFVHKNEFNHGDKFGSMFSDS
jgi:hypothetical protein